MPVPPAGFADPYTLLKTWIDNGIGPDLGLKVDRLDSAGNLPTTTLYDLPLLILAVIGGLDRIVVDDPTVDFDVLAADQDSANTIARQLRYAALFTLPGYMTPDRTAWVKRTETVLAPAPRDFDETGIGRTGARYRISIRTAL